MSRNDSEFWTRARRAKDRLVAQFIAHPDVNLIDIGLVPESDEETEQIVLRIHVGEGWIRADPDERVAFPAKVSGIPVMVIFGEYTVGGSSRAPGEMQ